MSNGEEGGIDAEAVLPKATHMPVARQSQLGRSFDVCREVVAADAVKPQHIGERIVGASLSMERESGQISLQHVEINIMLFELLSGLLLKLFHLGHEVECVGGSEEGEVEVARSDDGRCGVFQRLGMEVEGFGVDAVVAHLQIERIYLSINTEEFVKIV